MTNDLKNFLEEEITDFSIDFGHAKNCDVQPPNDGEQICSCGYEELESRVKSMNTRLINFVLDLVEKEVEKIEKECWAIEHYEESLKKLSTIINNLRV